MDVRGNRGSVSLALGKSENGQMINVKSVNEEDMTGKK